MNIGKIHDAIQALHEVLKEEAGPYAVSGEVFISHAEYRYEIKTRTPDSLNMQGISMRNLKGDFIK